MTMLPYFGKGMIIHLYCEENSKALLRSLHFLIWEAKITKIRAHTRIAHKYCSFGWCLNDLQNDGISK